MAEYTSTRNGFQQAMKLSLTGPSADAEAYAAATVMPNFYHLVNNERRDYDEWVQGISEQRQKVSEYEPKV